jgi:hypothetical protein
MGRCAGRELAATACALLLAGIAPRAAAQMTPGAQVTPDLQGAPPAPAAAGPVAPAGGLARWLDPSRAPFIPIPEIDADPQSGLTVGLIPTFLTSNDQDQLVRIVAPDIIHSQYFGFGSRMRIFGYPSADTQWSVVGGLKERVEREFDAQLVTGQTRTHALSYSVEAVYDRSGTARFFGLGNRSSYADQTTYVDEQLHLQASVGLNFTPALQLAYVARMRYADVMPGVLQDIPSTETLFPHLAGLGSEHALEHSVVLTYDDRDSPVIPQSGARYLVYAGFVSRAFASSVSYTWCGAEAQYYWTFDGDMTLAWHAAARYMPSSAEAPFWALSSLGGDRSISDEREPLRSAGADRYIDRDLFASGAELRKRVAGFAAFGTNVALEVAPFVDAGRVFANLGTNPLRRLHTAAGLGVRGVASPYVVGYVDVGAGDGRPVVFSGINYPF